MDDAIKINSSKLEFTAQLVSGALGCYWVIRFESSLTVKVPLFCLLLWILIRSYQNWKSQVLKGRFYLTAEGLVQADSTSWPKPIIYQAKLLQRLPWCLQLKIRSGSQSFKKLIWRDALNRQDWCQLRRYLNPL